MSTRSPRGPALALGLAILAATLAVYWPSFGFEFTNYDDPAYVTHNPRVTGGLTAENVRWAFTEAHAHNWHPLTWLSHQLDCTLFGVQPGPPHVVNVVLHLTNTALLLALLLALGFSSLSGAWIAALFALHPLHVESVAWVSERKDVLSTFFALLASLAYVGHARHGGAARYGLAALLFALGLMSKPMLVTLPVVWLLLDHWPLARLRDRAGSKGNARRALLEKLPLLALSAASAAVTIVVQGDAKSSLDRLGIAERVQTAVVGYARYVLKMFWPVDSAVLYPNPYLPGGAGYSALEVGGSALLLVAISAAVAVSWRRGWTVLGWGWFVVMLLPVCGLVQVGSSAIADRYTYLSYVGLWILVAQLGVTVRVPAVLLRGAGVLSVLLCAWLTWRAVPHWQSSETLFRRALEVSPHSPLAHVKIGAMADQRRAFEEAEEHFRRALELRPTMHEAQLGLATTLNRSGRAGLAIPEYRRAIEMSPRDPMAYTQLGLLLTMRGQGEEGLALLERARELAPDDPLVLRNLGLAYQSTGGADGAARALAALTRSLELEPDPVAARAFAPLAIQAGEPRRAARTLERVLARVPDDVELRWSCASAWSRAGDAERTRAHVAEALRRAPGAFSSYKAGSLAMRVGAVDEAIAHFERAVREDPTLEAAQKALAEARRRRGEQ